MGDGIWCGEGWGMGSGVMGDGIWCDGGWDRCGGDGIGVVGMGSGVVIGDGNKCGWE